jgi:hypothetical protein
MAGSSQSLAAKAVIPIAAARYSSRLAVDLRRVVMGLGRLEKRGGACDRNAPSARLAHLCYHTHQEVYRNAY